jgi:hypothetical protein
VSRTILLGFPAHDSHVIVQLEMGRVCAFTEDQRQPTPPIEECGSGWRKQAGSILMIAIPVALWFAPLSLEANAKYALAISAFMIIGWASRH